MEIINVTTNVTTYYSIGLSYDINWLLYSEEMSEHKESHCNLEKNGFCFLIGLRSGLS